MTKLHLFTALKSAIFMIVLIIGPQSSTNAQNIRFATADGRFEITGKIVRFMLDGQEIDQPQLNAPNLSIVIEREDGSMTAPVPIAKLSKETLNSIRESLESPKEAVPEIGRAHV